MKFTQTFCKDKEFIELIKHKNKYDLVLSEIVQKNFYLSFTTKDYSDRINFYITDNITISCNLL